MRTYVRVCNNGSGTQKSDNPFYFDNWGCANGKHVDYEINFNTLEVIRITPEKQVIKWQRGLKVRASQSSVVWLCSQQPGEDTKLVTNLTTANVFPVNILVAVENDVFDPDYWEVVE